MNVGKAIRPTRRFISAAFPGDPAGPNRRKDSRISEILLSILAAAGSRIAELFRSIIHIIRLKSSAQLSDIRGSGGSLLSRRISGNPERAGLPEELSAGRALAPEASCLNVNEANEFMLASAAHHPTSLTPTQLPRVSEPRVEREYFNRRARRIGRDDCSADNGRGTAMQGVKVARGVARNETAARHRSAVERGTASSIAAG